MSKRTKRIIRAKKTRFFFIDGQGDSKTIKKVMRLAKKHGRTNDLYVIDFSKGQGGSFSPETGVFTPNSDK